jgi:hypothetical protein
MTEQEVAQLGVPEIVEAERKLAMISQDRLMRVDYERRKIAHHDAMSQTRESWVEEGRRQGVNEGKRLALVEMLVEALHERGLPLSAELRVRLDGEADLARLKRWAARAVQAGSVEDVLGS